MFTQIYSIQTVEEALGCVEAGADRIGVLVGTPGGKFPCAIHEEEAEKIFEALKGKAVRVLISVADNERDILDQTKRLHPDVLHLWRWESWMRALWKMRRRRLSTLIF